MIITNNNAEGSQLFDIFFIYSCSYKLIHFEQFYVASFNASGQVHAIIFGNTSLQSCSATGPTNYATQSLQYKYLIN